MSQILPYDRLNSPKCFDDGQCDRLATAGVSRLICGFIDRAGHDALVASGVDVRVGACRGPALQLVACFYELPKLFS